MKITSTTFITSVPNGGVFPEGTYPHVAFIGRSNVGKSSTLNALLGNSKLAHTSSNPGHTKTINFFVANKRYYIVDLPGYGFAKGSHALRDELGDTIQWYFNYPEKISQQKIVLIIDAKVGLTKLDLEMIDYLTEREKDFVIVANKIDKLSQGEKAKAISAIKLALPSVSIFPFSAEKKIGVGELSHALFA